MIKNFNEVPNTIEGLEFYIDRSEKSIKDYEQKANRLRQLQSEARERLRNYKSSPIKEEMNETK